VRKLGPIHLSRLAWIQLALTLLALYLQVEERVIQKREAAERDNASKT